MVKLGAPRLPVDDVVGWKKLSHTDRLRPLMTNWTLKGSEIPGVVYLMYIVKMAVYVFGGFAIIAATTPGIGSIWQFGSWWSEPIVYQKAVIFTMLFEVFGLGCGMGPKMFRVWPPTAALLHWFRWGTLRHPPWPRVVPFTGGDTRAVVDVVLFAAFCTSAIIALVSPGGGTPPPGCSHGLLSPWLIAPMVSLLAIVGLRDKTIFLAARAEVYWIPAVIFLFPYDQMMIGLKIALAATWIGAGIGKLTHIYPYVVAPMMSDAPLRPRWFKRMMYRDIQHDIRPSGAAVVVAHVGTAIELVVPVVLLLSHGGWVSLIAVAVMVVFHLHLVSTIPVAVPNEWNLFTAFGVVTLFWAHADASLTHLSNPLLICFLLLTIFLPIVLGNVRPDLVSLLLSMRYYVGNTAAGMWCFKGDSWRKLDQHIIKASRINRDQLARLYDEDVAELAHYVGLAYRCLLPQGRALNSLILRALGDRSAQYEVFDGETLGGVLNGWNFGCGHLHHEQLLAAVQRRCNYAEGELILVFLESQPLHRRRLAYRIVDAATGLIETGYIQTKDMLAIPLELEPQVPAQVTYRR